MFIFGKTVSSEYIWTLLLETKTNFWCENLYSLAFSQTKVAGHEIPVAVRIAFNYSKRNKLKGAYSSREGGSAF